MAELHARNAADRVNELEEWGAIFDRTKDGLISQRNFGGHRYARLRKWLTDFKNAAGGLDGLWYEDCPFTRPGDSQAPRLYGGFEATVTCWCEHHGIPYTAVNTKTIKKFATGNGNAKKPDMVHAMRARGYTPVDDNEADALALLLLALERMECGRAA